MATSVTGIDAKSTFPDARLLWKKFKFFAVLAELFAKSYKIYVFRQGNSLQGAKVTWLV